MAPKKKTGATPKSSSKAAATPAASKSTGTAATVPPQREGSRGTPPPPEEGPTSVMHSALNAFELYIAAEEKRQKGLGHYTPEEGTEDHDVWMAQAARAWALQHEEEARLIRTHLDPHLKRSRNEVTDVAGRECLEALRASDAAAAKASLAKRLGSTTAAASVEAIEFALLVFFHSFTNDGRPSRNSFSVVLAARSTVDALTRDGALDDYELVAALYELFCFWAFADKWSTMDDTKRSRAYQAALSFTSLYPCLAPFLRLHSHLAANKHDACDMKLTGQLVVAAGTCVQPHFHANIARLRDLFDVTFRPVWYALPPEWSRHKKRPPQSIDATPKPSTNGDGGADGEATPELHGEEAGTQQSIAPPRPSPTAVPAPRRDTWMDFEIPVGAASGPSGGKPTKARRVDLVFGDIGTAAHQPAPAPAATRQLLGVTVAPTSDSFGERTLPRGPQTGRVAVAPAASANLNASRYPCRSVYHAHYSKGNKHASPECQFCSTCHMMEILFNGYRRDCTWSHGKLTDRKVSTHLRPFPDVYRIALARLQEFRAGHNLDPVRIPYDVSDART